MNCAHLERKKSLGPYWFHWMPYRYTWEIVISRLKQGLGFIWIIYSNIFYKTQFTASKNQNGIYSAPITSKVPKYFGRDDCLLNNCDISE